MKIRSLIKLVLEPKYFGVNPSMDKQLYQL